MIKIVISDCFLTRFKHVHNILLIVLLLFVMGSNF